MSAAWVIPCSTMNATPWANPVAEPLHYIPAVLEAHLDQGAFLWQQWYDERFGEQPDAAHAAHTLSRLAPHREGWLLQPEAAWALYRERCTLGLADAGEHFLGACLALQGAQVEQVRAVMDEAGDCATLMAIHDAMHQLPASRIRPWAERFATARHTTLSLLGQLFIDPTLSGRSAPLPADASPGLLEFLSLSVRPRQTVEAALIEAAVRLPPADRFRLGRHLLGSANRGAVLAALLPLTLEPADYRDEVIRRCFHGLDQATAKQWIQRLKTSDDSARAMILAIGALREKALLPWVLQRLHEPPLARVAGWAITQLLNVDLAERGWIAPEPAIDAPFIDDPRDLNWPWPDAEAITAYVYQERATQQEESPASRL